MAPTVQHRSNQAFGLLERLLNRPSLSVSPLEPQGFVLVSGCGRWPIALASRRLSTGGGSWVAGGNRLLFLLSAMLLCTGVLMALDAPRTLSRLLLLMTVLECLVLGGAVALMLLTRLRRALRGRRLMRREKKARRPSPTGAAVHWWTYEAVLLLLGAWWLGSH